MTPTEDKQRLQRIEDDITELKRAVEELKRTTVRRKPSTAKPYELKRRGP